MSKTFRKLTPAQQRVFEQIAKHQDGGYRPATLKALVRKEMIQVEWVKKGHANIRRYFVPIAIHLAWREWCAEQPEEDTCESASPATETGALTKAN